MVVAGGDDPPGRQFAAPYAATSIGEYFVEKGRDVLIVYDDLTRHARAEDGKFAVLLIGSDEGMCGQFNESIAGHMVETFRVQEKRQPAVLVVVGHRAAVLVEEEGFEPDQVLPVPGSLSGILPLVQELLITLESWRSERRVERILVFGNRRKKGAAYEESKTVLLPLDWQRLRELGTKQWKSRSLPVFSMNSEALLAALIREYLSMALFLSVGVFG